LDAVSLLDRKACWSTRNSTVVEDVALDDGRAGCRVQ
jgi:hypothetical protein